MQRADEAEAKAIKTVETWKESPEFDVLAQDAYVVALEELVKHIHRERLDFDAAFLEEALEEQKKGITEAIRGYRSSVVPY